MPTAPLHVVTGAFGYSGRYITRRLLAEGKRVLTLTNHPDRPNPFGDAVQVAPYNFDNPHALAHSIKGAEVLYNTYWIRYPYKGMTHEMAVENAKTLFRAAKEAGVKRFVHVSIAHPDANSPLVYYRGKAAMEQALTESGLSYAILRPAVLFGGERPAEDVLINNIAWILRRSPAFGLPGDGQYGIQPIHVEDMAALAVWAGAQNKNLIRDAVGPETYTFEELVHLIKRAVGSRAVIMKMHPKLALLAGQIIGGMLGDVLLTDEEVQGLMGNLLVSDEEPSGKIKLSVWLAENARLMGVKYSNEVRRHFK